MCLMVVSLKRTFYRNGGLSKTCQCQQLKLNQFSTQINIYCLMTNQTSALLVQHAAWTRAAVMLLQSLYFSHPPTPTAIILDAHPPRYIWKSRGPQRSHEKIADCEQCNLVSHALLRFEINKPTCTCNWYSGTSPLGHLNSGTTRFGPGKMLIGPLYMLPGLQILLMSGVSVTSASKFW